MIATSAASKSDWTDADDRLSATVWTEQQTAYALFLNNACFRLEIIADEIGIEPTLVDGFVRDVLVIAYRARHTRTRGRESEAWIEAIARNLGRKHRYRAAREPRMTLFWSLCRFARDHRQRGGYTETQRLPSEVIPTATTM